MNISLLEFNYNFIIYISGYFKDYILKKCYITLVNIIYSNNKKIFETDYSKNEIFGIEFYNSVFEDNNILIKLSEDILGIGGSNIYLYSLKYKEIFQTIEIPFNNYININFSTKTASSFFATTNKIKNFSDFDNFEIKFFIYYLKENSYLNNIKELVLLSEANPNSQEEFYNAFEIQN